MDATYYVLTRDMRKKKIEDLSLERVPYGQPAAK